MAVTIMREAIDEFRRFQRDKEVNSQLYSKLTVRGQQDTFDLVYHLLNVAITSELT